MVVKEEEMVLVTPGEVLGKATEVKAGKGAYVAKHNGLVYASLTGLLRTLSPPPDSPDQLSGNFLEDRWARPQLWKFVLSVECLAKSGKLGSCLVWLLSTYVKQRERTQTKDLAMLLIHFLHNLRQSEAGKDLQGLRATVEVTGHKAHGPVPEPGSVVIARVTKVMTRMASADIMCVGAKSVREKFSGIISIESGARCMVNCYRLSFWATVPYCHMNFSCFALRRSKLLFNRQQDVRATEIDKVDMHLSFRPGDIVRASVVSFML
ncbi:S1 motif domain-containing protein [Citrus sinensis]|uniref:S1 motif domain-containing protein n=1 Tax=Citrus sinensis TaxID=2711 RepID=A0ACB8MFG3_CITSI|nr:S1 motif domain-containing protein [Citrus sinensis]